MNKTFAALSRKRAFLAASLYYIVYQNWAALTDFGAGPFGWIKSVVFAIGNALVGADTTIEQAARQLATGTVPPVTHTFDLILVEWTFRSPALGEIAALVAIMGALSTLILYFRFSRYLLKRVNPNLGVFEVSLFPLVLYIFAVIAASAVAGSVRVPFQGVAYLVQNFDAVVETVRMNASVNKTNVTQSSFDPVREWLVNQSTQ